MKFGVLRIISWFFLTGVLLLLVFTPTIFGISDELIRSNISVASVLLLSVFLLTFFYLKSEISFTSSPISIAIFLLFLILIFSSAFSISIQQSLFGFGMEVGTVSSFVVLLLFYFASKNFFSNYVAIDSFYKTISASLFFLTLIVLVATFFNSRLFIFDIYNFSVFAGAIFLMSVIRFEFHSNSIYTFLLIILSYFGILLSNDRSIHIAVFIGILIIIFTKLFLFKKQKERTGIPYILITACVFITSLFFFSAQPIINLNQVNELKPSFETTRIVMSDTIIDSPLRAILGTGPNTFSYDWSLNKPRFINDTPVWNVDFRDASSGLATLFLTTGLLGGLAFLIIIGATFYAGILSLIRNSSSESLTRLYVVCTAFVTSIYGLIMYVFEVQSISNLILTFVFLSILSTLSVARNTKYISIPKLFKIIIIFIFAALIAVSSFFLLVKIYYVISFERNVISFNETGDINRALERIRCAPKYIEHSACNRFLAELYRDNLQSIFSNYSGQLPSVDESSRLSSLMLINAKRAVESNRIYYKNWVVLGNVYTQLALMGVQDGYENGIKSYDRAIELSPTNPFLFLLKAKLVYYVGENIIYAKQLVQKSLDLKPDYRPSVMFQEELDI